MDGNLLDVVATWAGVGLSVLAMASTAWVRFRTDSREELQRLQGEVDALRSFRDRMEGAGVLKRVVDLETRQRSTDTALARVEQRLSSIDALLGQIAGNVQALLHRGDQ